MKSRVYDARKVQWQPLRPDVSRGVNAKAIVPKEMSGTTVTIARVDPLGEFKTHTDEYGHAFYFLEGTGEGWIGDVSYDIRPGIAVEIAAGEAHGYRNTGSGPIYLITVNIPAGTV